MPKPTVFGVDFSVAVQDNVDGVPSLVKKCIAEIDNRALTVKVSLPAKLECCRCVHG